MTVMQALSVGGGVTPRGTDRGVKIRRKTGDGTQAIDARLIDPVQADDVIYVRERLFYGSASDFIVYRRVVSVHEFLLALLERCGVFTTLLATTIIAATVAS